jgi:hypothetical protein
MNHFQLSVAAVVGLVALSGCSIEPTGSSQLSPPDPAAVEGPIESMTTAPDKAGRSWAPAASADITPGVQTYTQDGQCTTNFVFIDDAGNTYIGQSAHCAGTGEPEGADDPADGGWAHRHTAPTPGVPGDSGSAFLDSHGRALGTLSTIALSLPAVNAVGDLNYELAYARAHSGITGLRLVLGTQPFRSS